MLDTYPIRTSDLPEDQRFLLEDYPRDSWQFHPGFKERTRHWLGAHKMFRRLGKQVRTDVELFLDKEHDPQEYAGRLSHYGGILVGNLHGHHGWEDRNYFPELQAADPRFSAGLELLEKDHEELDAVLDGFVEAANSAIQLIRLDGLGAETRNAAGSLLHVSETIEAFLARHLADEEDLTVPIILHHRLRG